MPATRCLERNHFVKNRLGVRFGASGHNSAVANNEFTDNKDAGLWAVRSAPDSHDEAIGIHDNKFTEDGTGIVAGNIPVLMERNDFINAHEADVHVVGAGAVIRGNHINGGASMGIVVENARGAIIEDNELEGLTAYGVMVRGSSNTLVRGEPAAQLRLRPRVRARRCAQRQHGGRQYHHRAEVQRHRCDRRLAELAAQPGAARPRLCAARRGFPAAQRSQRCVSQPFLDNNNFGNSPVSKAGATVAAQPSRQ